MWKDIVLPISSACVALAGIGSAMYTQHLTSSSQMKLKAYELSFSVKQKGYGAVVRALGECQQNLIDGDQTAYRKSVASLETEYLALEPFIKEPRSRDAVWTVIVALRNATSLVEPKKEPNTATDPRVVAMYNDNVKRLREILYHALFESEP